MPFHTRISLIFIIHNFQNKMVIRHPLDFSINLLVFVVNDNRFVQIFTIKTPINDVFDSCILINKSRITAFVGRKSVFYIKTTSFFINLYYHSLIGVRRIFLNSTSEPSACTAICPFEAVAFVP